MHAENGEACQIANGEWRMPNWPQFDLRTSHFALRTSHFDIPRFVVPMRVRMQMEPTHEPGLRSAGVLARSGSEV
jgi:hypothetical protein